MKSDNKEKEPKIGLRKKIKAIASVALLTLSLGLASCKPGIIESLQGPNSFTPTKFCPSVDGERTSGVGYLYLKESPDYLKHPNWDEYIFGGSAWKNGDKSICRFYKDDKFLYLLLDNSGRVIGTSFLSVLEWPYKFDALDHETRNKLFSKDYLRYMRYDPKTGNIVDGKSEYYDGYGLTFELFDVHPKNMFLAFEPPLLNDKLKK